MIRLYVASEKLVKEEKDVLPHRRNITGFSCTVSNPPVKAIPSIK